MRGKLLIAHCPLITSFPSALACGASVFLLSFLIACTPQTPQPPLQTSFYVYRFDPSALIEFSEEFQPVGEIPFLVPPNCGLFNIFPAPIGHFMAIELNCPNGQTVLYLDLESAIVTQPVTDSDSHFLAWTPDGEATYLKVDSLGNARVIRAYTDGAQDLIAITESTYDLVPSLNQSEFTFTFSRGLGQGSELWLAKRDGNVVEQLHADPFNYISFARWSPNGEHLAFIKIPDTSTPFTVGELWVMGANSSNARKLADSDAGHGYAANWSPDGKRIAFVARENPEDERADQSSESLISNIYIVDVEGGALTQLTRLTKGHVETPFWSPDGNSLAFNVVINGRMDVHNADIITGRMQTLLTESTCCPAWMRK
jgi:Tol biopolymer transport system component